MCVEETAPVGAHVGLLTIYSVNTGKQPTRDGLLNMLVVRGAKNSSQ